MTESTTERPSDLLMEFVLGLLASLLMTGSVSDLHLARLAAQETIAAYKAREQSELITIGQILAFALTALDNLRLSMTPDLSLSMKLKLRGNANVLNRSARDSTQTLEKARRDNPPLAPSIAEQAAMTAWEEVEPDPIAATGPDKTPPVPEEAQDAPAVRASAVPGAFVTTEHRNRLHWADAMKTEAVRLQACAAHVSLAQQKANTLWVEVLTGVASDLSQGKCAGITSPGMSKAAPLRTTLMSGDPDFPAHLSNGIQRSGAAVRKRTQQTKRV